MQGTKCLLTCHECCKASRRLWSQPTVEMTQRETASGTAQVCLDEQFVCFTVLTTKKEVLLAFLTCNLPIRMLQSVIMIKIKRSLTDCISNCIWKVICKLFITDLHTDYATAVLWQCKGSAWRLVSERWGAISCCCSYYDSDYTGNVVGCWTW